MNENTIQKVSGKNFWYKVWSPPRISNSNKDMRERLIHFEYTLLRHVHKSNSKSESSSSAFFVELRTFLAVRPFVLVAAEREGGSPSLSSSSSESLLDLSSPNGPLFGGMIAPASTSTASSSVRNWASVGVRDRHITFTNLPDCAPDRRPKLLSGSECHRSCRL